MVLCWVIGVSERARKKMGRAGSSEGDSATSSDTTPTEAGGAWEALDKEPDQNNVQKRVPPPERPPPPGIQQCFQEFLTIT